uniref:F-box domain-containing protein n=1 Tax=Meloidogyne hapla TaxID=6305 RepID=A0A1I8BFN2_MELHA
MFNNLPLESKLDIFKYLNIKQLTSFRQTNYYFNALIDRYEGELARKELNGIEIIEFVQDSNYKFINIEDGVFKIKITDQLMEKVK